MTPPGSELRRVRSLIADLEGIVWEADASSMTFTFVSEGTNEILGYAPVEWLSEPSFWADHIHPEDRQRAVGRFVRVATEGGHFDQEYRFLAQDGGWVWLRDIGHGVKDVNGEPVLIRGLMVEITTQKALEYEAHEAEDRFRRVVEQLPAIVYLEAVQRVPEEPGRMLYVSPQVESILGFSPDEWLRDPIAWARQFHPDDRARIRQDYARVERTGRPLRAEYRMYTRTGEIRWFRDEAILVRDPDGEPMHWQGMMFDVTAEHTSEERARESEDRYRALVEQIPAIVYQEDINGPALQLMYISPRVEAVLGIPPDEWVGDPETWSRAIHPDDREGVLAENVRVDETGEPFAMEYRMESRDGRMLWFRDEAVLILDADGEPLYWQGVMLDITRRREAEAHVVEAEARYRALVEQTPAVVYIDPIEQGGATIYISPQVEAMLGYAPAEWYAQPGLWRQIVHPEDREILEAQPAIEAPTASSYRIVAKDGRTVWIHDQSTLILDEDGSPRYWLGVLIDVTEQRRSQELSRALERERDEAERLRLEDEMKTTFLQAVSHDLRTPLAAILGLAVTLEREDVEIEAGESRDMAHRIAVNARKLDGIVSDFLDLERLSRGVATPAYELLDLGALVRELVANSELVAERRLALDVAPLTVPADPAMVGRIVENLLGNTVKHTPGDSRIWVRLERREDGALLTVEDDGPGVPEDDRARIFEAFRQGSGAASGSGVGLALVARFAELHGGRAWVEERDGGGASFRVLFGWEPSAAPEPAPAPEELDAAEDQP
ncbi:MAG TPA: PAS domain-containing protein [Actinomycetota bacterium]|jgi:PAS domain S-box-containing protein